MRTHIQAHQPPLCGRPGALVGLPGNASRVCWSTHIQAPQPRLAILSVQAEAGRGALSGALVIDVIDQGPGISQENQQLLFKDVVQVRFM